VTVLDLDDDGFSLVTTLNPKAKEFYPPMLPFFPIDDETDEARRVDDIMKTVHHLLSVSDSENLAYAEQFAEADVPIDDATSFGLDQQEALSEGLYQPSQRAKGCTYSRKKRDGHRSRRPGY